MNILIALLIVVLAQVGVGGSIWSVCPIEPVAAVLVNERSAYVYETFAIDPLLVAQWTGEPLYWDRENGFAQRRLPEFVMYRLIVTSADGSQVYGLLTRNRVGEWFAYLTRDLPDDLAEDWHATCGGWRLDEVARP